MSWVGSMNMNVDTGGDVDTGRLMDACTANGHQLDWRCSSPKNANGGEAGVVADWDRQGMTRESYW